MDFGEMILRAIRLLDERPAARRRVSRALPRGARGRVPGHQLRPEGAAAAAGRRAPQRRRGRRRRPVDLPLPGRVAQEHPRLPGDVPGREGDPAGDQLPLQPGDPRRRARGRRAERASACRRSCARRAAAPRSASTPSSFWRCENERAQAQAVAAELERLIADGVDPARDRRAGALGAQRGPADGDRARGARHPLPAGRAARGFFERAEVRDLLAWLRLLADPQDARAVVRALMRPPVELGPVDLARCTTDRAPAQDRHGLGAARRARVARRAARGARADRDLPEAAPQRVPRVRRDAPRPVRAPPDRAHRPAQAVPVQHQHRVARAARQHRQVRRPRRRLGAPRAGPQLARLRRVRERRRRRRAARGGGGRARATRAPCR